MADFAVAVRLTAENQISGQLRQVETSLDGVASAARDVSIEARGMDASTQAAARSSGTLGAGARAAQTALRSTSQEAGRSQQAMRNLNAQIGDIGAQLASGGSPLTVLAVQANQVGMALTDMGGRAGKIGAFLAGPWGTALGLAAVAASSLAAGLFEIGDAADVASSKQSNLARFYDQRTGAVNRQTSAILRNLEALRQGRKAQGEQARYDEARNVFLSAAERPLRANVSGDQVFASSVSQRGQQQVRAIVEQQRAGSIGIAEVERRILELAKTDKTLKPVVDAIKGLAGAAVEAAVEVEKTRGTINILSDKPITAVQRTLLGIVPAGQSATDIIAKVKAAQDDAEGAAARHKTRIDELTTAYNNGFGTINAEQFAAGVRQADAELAAAQDRYAAAQKAASEAQREMTRATRELAKAQREAERDMEAQERLILSIGKSARQTADELINLGRINLDANAIGRVPTGFSDTAERENKELFPEYARIDDRKAAEFGERIADEFRADGLIAAQAIGDLIGGKAGSRIASALSLLSGQGGGGLQAGIQSIFGKEAGDSFKKTIKDTFRPAADALKSIVGPRGAAVAGQLGAGASIGAGVASLGQALGLGGSKTGGAIGGALGSFFGPVGSIVGSILGSAVGGLLKKTKSGSATIGNVDGSADVTGTGGNNSQRIGAAKGLAGAVGSSLQQIVDSLGAQLGTFSGSIGVRKDTFKVDPTGRGRTKGSGVLSFKDEADAQAALLRDAIADGAVKGVSAAVAQALRSSTDIDRALKEALKVQELEALISGPTGAVAKAFADLNRAEAERVRLARAYGLDLVAVERVNAEQRAAVAKAITEQQTGALKAALDEILIGDLFEGDAVGRRAELQRRLTDAQAANDNAAVAQIIPDLLRASRDANGTAGVQYADDRTGKVDLLQTLLAQENKRVADAEAASRAEVVKQTGFLNENNNQNARMLAALDGLPGRLADIIGGSLLFGNGNGLAGAVAAVAR